MFLSLPPPLSTQNNAPHPTTHTFIEITLMPPIFGVNALKPYPKDLSRLCAGDALLLSAQFLVNSSRTLSKKAYGICRPYASSATTRYAARQEPT